MPHTRSIKISFRHNFQLLTKYLHRIQIFSLLDSILFIVLNFFLHSTPCSSSYSNILLHSTTCPSSFSIFSFTRFPCSETYPYFSTGRFYFPLQTRLIPNLIRNWSLFGISLFIIFYEFYVYFYVKVHIYTKIKSAVRCYLFFLL